MSRIEEGIYEFKGYMQFEPIGVIGFYKDSGALKKDDSDLPQEYLDNRALVHAFIKLGIIYEKWVGLTREKILEIINEPDKRNQSVYETASRCFDKMGINDAGKEELLQQIQLLAEQEKLKTVNGENGIRAALEYNLIERDNADNGQIIYFPTPNILTSIIASQAPCIQNRSATDRQEGGLKFGLAGKG